MDIKIKEVTNTNDVPQLAPLAISLIKTQNLPFKTGGEQCYAGFVDQYIRNPDGRCFVAVNSKGDIVGWIGAKNDYYAFSDEKFVQVSAWDVAPELRAEGVGGKLMRKVIEWALSIGSKLITVGVNPSSSGKPELAYNKLEKLGFKEFERTFYINLS